MLGSWTLELVSWMVSWTARGGRQPPRKAKDQGLIAWDGTEDGWVCLEEWYKKIGRVTEGGPVTRSLRALSRSRASRMCTTTRPRMAA